MRNGSLWSDRVFEKEVFFHEFDFGTSSLALIRSRSQTSESTPTCEKGVFYYIHICQLRQPIELKFSQVCYFMHTKDTPSEETGLWQLPIVSTVFILYHKTKMDHVYNSKRNYKESYHWQYILHIIGTRPVVLLIS